MVKYTECPYCPFKYKGESQDIRLAVFGHIKLKHPGAKLPVVTKEQDLKIPEKDKKLINEQIKREKAALLKRLKELGE